LNDILLKIMFKLGDIINSKTRKVEMNEGRHN